MGHLHQRLATRVPPRVAEMAHTLLREPRVLAHWFHLLARRLPELAGAPRVALPLAPGDRPPLLLVERTGVGVTCLAAGMACDAPRVPAHEVAGLCELLERRFRKRVLQQRLMADPELDGTLARALSCPDKLTLAAFRHMQTLAPLLTDRLDDWLEEVTRLLDRGAYDPAVLRYLTDKEAADVWRLYLGVAFCLVAVGTVHADAQRAWAAALAPDVMLAARGSWLQVNQPERTLAFVEDCWKAHVPGVKEFSWPLLVAMGCRFGRWRAACEALAKAMGEERRMIPQGRMLEHVRRLLLARACHLVPLRARFDGAPKADVEALRHAAAAPRTAYLEGADFAGMWERTPGPARELFHALDLAREWDVPASMVLPPGDPDARAALRAWAWQRVLASQPESMLSATAVDQALVTAAPLAALVPPPAPADWMALSYGVRLLREHLPRVMGAFRVQTVTREAPRIGRNGPCPCGSGKKHKKCCGAA